MDRPDAVAQVIEAFQSFNLVGLGERHGARQDSEFRLRVIRHPDFRRARADIVVEFASALYQDVLDRFIEGGDVPAEGLRRIWRDTTQPGAWDSPVYEQFLRAVREVNGELPPGQRLRVLAGDPPIDWNAESQEQIGEWLEARDRFAASVIDREVLGRNRKALVVYGALHLCRKRAGTIVETLQGDHRARWFVILPLEGCDTSVGEPKLVQLADSPAGSLEANDLIAKDTKQVKIVDGKMVLLRAQFFEPGVKLRNVADAGIDFGNETEIVPRPEGIAGTEYGSEIDRRRAILMRLAPRSDSTSPR